jgi:hypothetical protein
LLEVVVSKVRRWGLRAAVRAHGREAWLRALRE